MALRRPSLRPGRCNGELQANAFVPLGEAGEAPRNKIVRAERTCSYASMLATIRTFSSTRDLMKNYEETAATRHKYQLIVDEMLQLSILCRKNQSVPLGYDIVRLSPAHGHSACRAIAFENIETLNYACSRLGFTGELQLLPAKQVTNECPGIFITLAVFLFRSPADIELYVEDPFTAPIVWLGDMIDPVDPDKWRSQE